MSEEENRRAFESWMSAPPYEMDVSRFSPNESTSAWSGLYRDDAVEIAWKAWCESPKVLK